MSRLIDLTGQKFGKWTVLGRAPNNKDDGAMWHCQCNCGRQAIISRGNLRSGASCQCLHCKFVKHGFSRTKLYRVLQGMIQRCENPNSRQYKYYGGRGIKVCSEWKRDFNIFRVWAINHGYKHYLAIDRIDNNGNYEPGNCRFITMAMQNRNIRTNRLIKIGGETKLLCEWAEQAGINYDTLYYRILRGWPEHRLLEPTVK